MEAGLGGNCLTWHTIQTKLSSVAVEIVERLAVNPYVTINKVAEDLGISYSTAQRGIQKLEAENIIQKTADNKRDKVYCANAILNILEEPTKINAEADEYIK